MRKLRLTIAILMLSLLLSGCVKKPHNMSETASGNLPQVSNQNSNQKHIIKAQDKALGMERFSEVTSYIGDLDADGADEEIALYTSAERMNNGKFIWNDGQEWLLLIKDKIDGYYVLLDEFVQAGNVYFEVSDYYMKDGAVPKISVTTSTGAGFSLKNYTFSKNFKGYESETIFDTKNVTEAGINRRFSSFPLIEK